MNEVVASPLKIHHPFVGFFTYGKKNKVLFFFPNIKLGKRREGEETMVQIIGKEQIVLPNVKRMEVSDITPVGEPGNPSSYQRILRFVTDTGTLTLFIEAKERNTICFTADPQIVDEATLHLNTEGEEYD
jgi:hypothetical protein